jgi:predicted nuclease with TOPRIM domain
MPASVKELKSRILKLLREDEEFRYAVAGLIGLEEILRRLDRHEAELVKLREDMVRHEAELVRLREDMNKLREDMIRGF